MVDARNLLIRSFYVLLGVGLLAGAGAVAFAAVPSTLGPHPGDREALT